MEKSGRFFVRHEYTLKRKSQICTDSGIYGIIYNKIWRNTLDKWNDI